MSEKIKITKNAENILKEKQRELLAEIKVAQKKNDPFDSVLLSQKPKLKEVEEVLNNSIVVEFTEKEPVSVILGARIILEDLITSDKKEFVIMTRSTSNPLKGVISSESPLAQKMMGLKLGNTFKFKDIQGLEENYKIKNIE